MCAARHPSARLPTGRGEFEARELKTGRDHACHQREICHATNRFCCLPMTGRYQSLPSLAGMLVGAEHEPALRAIVTFGHQQRKRIACLPKPQFVRIDPMPMRTLVALQQEQDRGSNRAASGIVGAAPGLPIPAAFGMRRQFQRIDQVLRVDGLPPCITASIWHRA